MTRIHVLWLPDSFFFLPPPLYLSFPLKSCSLDLASRMRGRLLWKPSPMAASFCSPGLALRTVLSIMSSSEGNPPPGRCVHLFIIPRNTSVVRLVFFTHFSVRNPKTDDEFLSRRIPVFLKIQSMLKLTSWELHTPLTSLSH